MGLMVTKVMKSLDTLFSYLWVTLSSNIYVYMLCHLFQTEIFWHLSPLVLTASGVQNPQGVFSNYTYLPEIVILCHIFLSLHFLIIADVEILVILIGQILNAYFIPVTIPSILSMLLHSPNNVPQHCLDLTRRKTKAPRN